MAEIQEVNVRTKEWSNPTAAGLVALAVACFCFFALLNGYVKPSAMPLIGCWLIGGFVVQIIVAFVDLKSGNHAGGNTFLYFSAFFMLASGMELFMKWIYIGELDATVDGYVWIVLALVTILWTPAFFKKFGILSLIVLALDIALPFLAIIDIGILDAALAADLKIVPAFAMLAAGLLAIYLSAATVVNTAFGKKIYPLS